MASQPNHPVTVLISLVPILWGRFWGIPSQRNDFETNPLICSWNPRSRSRFECSKSGKNTDNRAPQNPKIIQRCGIIFPQNLPFYRSSLFSCKGFIKEATLVIGELWRSVGMMSTFPLIFQNIGCLIRGGQDGPKIATWRNMATAVPSQSKQFPTVVFYFCDAYCLQPKTMERHRKVVYVHNTPGCLFFQYGYGSK